MHFLIQRGLSPTRACRLVQLPRATFQYQPRPDRNAELAAEVRELAAKHPRYGYRRIHALLRLGLSDTGRVQTGLGTSPGRGRRL